MVDFAFIDSGTGGIPYLLHMKEVLPDASCVYIGDTANFPYGEKSNEEVVECVTAFAQKVILKFSPKVIVIACNTMSVNALAVLREKFPETKFVGTVPAIKLASKNSVKRRIGLLATNSTVNHPYNKKLKEDFAADCSLVLRGDPDLISFIEHKSFISDDAEKHAAVQPAVDFFRKENCDVIILGCTHFLNLKKEIAEVCEPDIKVVDSVEGVVNHAVEVLESICSKNKKKIEENGGKQTKSLLFVTGFSDKKDEKEYDTICSRYGLEYKGLI